MCIRDRANASSEGVDLLELAAFVEGGDEDAQFTDGEQESPAKGRFRQPSVCHNDFHSFQYSSVLGKLPQHLSLLLY